MNYLIATKIMVDYLSSEGIYKSTAECGAVVAKWMQRLDINDPLSIAAVAISDPSQITLTESEIRKIREFYFPSKNFKEGGLY